MNYTVIFPTQREEGGLDGKLEFLLVRVHTERHDLQGLSDFEFFVDRGTIGDVGRIAEIEQSLDAGALLLLRILLLLEQLDPVPAFAGPRRLLNGEDAADVNLPGFHVAPPQHGVH